MAKNYLQDGKTLTFIADVRYQSGDMVRLKDRIVIAVTDIDKGEVGTGLTEGVFTLPKKPDVSIVQGSRVCMIDNLIDNISDVNKDSIGIAWESSASGASRIAVKLHG
ncbi:capsid cement protein [Pantoea endophytica]|uniref:DUF2190 family protein n=1 Tax=Pantoea TaxID=53335 RepID=UPI0024137FDE|nr:capsid cement protein [Pantoea endophytica]